MRQFFPHIDEAEKSRMGAKLERDKDVDITVTIEIFPQCGAKNGEFNHVPLLTKPCKVVFFRDFKNIHTKIIYVALANGYNT